MGQSVRLIIQFSGWHENGQQSEKKYQIIHFGEGEEVSMDAISDKLKALGELSEYRRNKNITIHSMQAF